MNMKKTMAAIAAGAVAVSAMATTASAVTLETKTLTYNLVKTVKESTDAEVKLTATFYNVPLVAGEDAMFTIKNLNEKDIVRISGTYLNENMQVVPILATKDKEQSGIYSVVTDAAMTTGSDGKLIVPILDKNVTTGFALRGGALTATPATPGTEAVAHEDGTATITASTVTNYNAGTITVTGKEDAFLLSTGSGKVMTFNDDAWKDAQGNNVTCTITLTDAGGNALTPTDGDTVTVNVTKAATAAAEATDPTPAQDTVSANITVEVNKKKLGAITGTSADITDKLENVNAELGNAAAKLGISLTSVTHGTTTATGHYTVTAGNTSTAAYIVASDFTKTAKIAQYPYRSTVNNALVMSAVPFYDITNSGDVLEHIYEVKTDNTANKINSYNVKAVINDAVQNYGDVTFVFNTATKKVAVPDDTHMENTWDMGHWNHAGEKYGCYVENDWEACSVADYRTFGNHYFNANQAGYDPSTTYILNNWISDNLFSGALLVNSNLTLSLDDTQKFDWTATSLSFTWEAIQDAALTKNQYANYIQNMVLRTSADWYWDNMQVILGETEVEEVESGAPVEGDVEDLPEDEEETDLGDVDEPEEEEEEEEESEPAPEVAPVVETNPGTGNAPVALAVIPVALAAAAIVAKKRG